VVGWSRLRTSPNLSYWETDADCLTTLNKQNEQFSCPLRKMEHVVGQRRLSFGHLNFHRQGGGLGYIY